MKTDYFFDEEKAKKSFFKNYQFMRNLSYIDDKTIVLFLFPEANNKLKKQIDLLNTFVEPSAIKKISDLFI